MWRVWEDFYGAREGVIMYSRVWEGFALGFLDVIKGDVGMQEFKTTEDLAKLNRAYWEAIGCEVEDVEQTDDRLVAIIKTCPYFDNMVDMYGKEAASEMMKKTIGADLRELLPGAHEGARALGHVLRHAGSVPLARGLRLPDGLHRAVSALPPEAGVRAA